MASITLTPALRTLVLAAAIGVAAAADGGDYQSTVEKDPGQPMLGIEMSPVPTNVQEREGLTPNQGVFVQNTFNNTAAQTMGIKPGDVVMSVNGTPIGSMSDLRNEVGLNTVGDPVAVVVQRNGNQVALNAPLQEWPKEIPRERIDPESERRFRQWQQDRLNQQRQQLDDAQRQLDDLDRATRPMPDAQALARAQELEKRLGAQPWELSWKLQHVDHDTPVAVADPAPAAPAADGAWRFDWTNDHRGAAP
jgi:membrane-associated protease RseP (regulator of RpoE activity)